MELSCSSISCACELHGVITDYAEIVGKMSNKADLKGDISGESKLTGEVQIYNAGAPPDYTGEYEVNPSQQTQVLPTAYTRLTKNVTINPIPEYYGLITWDGSVLTVS